MAEEGVVQQSDAHAHILDLRLQHLYAILQLDDLVASASPLVSLCLGGECLGHVVVALLQLRQLRRQLAYCGSGCLGLLLLDSKILHVGGDGCDVGGGALGCSADSGGTEQTADKLPPTQTHTLTLRKVEYCDANAPSCSLRFSTCSASRILPSAPTMPAFSPCRSATILSTRAPPLLPPPPPVPAPPLLSPRLSAAYCLSASTWSFHSEPRLPPRKDTPPPRLGV
ncbi:hypothetical protein B484DRAFT_122260 [Ochromonadaceae sp. CCMP2298]|nr:hypothetical protein B484DRAFT_122260 [Ochromonadaceae sp. CCMP2298]